MHCVDGGIGGLEVIEADKPKALGHTCKEAGVMDSQFDLCCSVSKQRVP